MDMLLYFLVWLTTVIFCGLAIWMMFSWLFRYLAEKRRPKAEIQEDPECRYCVFYDTLEVLICVLRRRGQCVAADYLEICGDFVQCGDLRYAQGRFWMVLCGIKKKDSIYEMARRCYGELLAIKRLEAI